MSVRKLSLRAEPLCELAAEDMRQVAGASHTCKTVTEITASPSCEGCRVPTYPPRVCLSLDGRLCSDTCTQ